MLSCGESFAMAAASGYLVLQGGERIAAVHDLSLGRAPQCDVVLEDVKASRRHARLVVQGSVVELEDLDSSNGTYLNGNRVKRKLLRDGDEIRIGLTSIKFVEAVPEAPRTVAVTPDDPYRPGGGLEGDPLAADPAPEVPVVEPAKPSVPDEDVEIVEFVDEVVEVKRAPAPTPAPTVVGGAVRRPSTTHRQHGVLQFSKHRRKSGLLGDDMRQMTIPQRALLVVLALVAAAAVVYAIVWLMSG